MLHTVQPGPIKPTHKPIAKHSLAYLDILGFKRKIETTDLTAFAAQYQHALDQTEIYNHPLQQNPEEPMLFPHQGQNPWCTRHIFSDSIILISDSDSSTSCLKLLIYTWRLSQMLLAMSLPVRGAVSFGDLYMDLDRNIILGLPLTRAYELEKKQNWIGTVIDNTVMEAFPEFSEAFNFFPESIPNVIFPEYRVPFKDGSKLRFRTINWRFNLVVELGTRSLFAQDGDHAVIEKVKNTLDYARAVVESKRIYFADPKTAPLELRTMWIGSKQPPFIHGDEI